MKRLAICLSLLVALAGSTFAQADLTPLVVVKLNKSETITLKKLKNRVETYKKQTNQASFSVDQKKEILNAMVDELLIVHAAQKEGLSITDTQVNQYFLASLSQQVGHQVTEAEFTEIVKKNTGLKLDDFMLQQVGMNVSDYKDYLKNQLLAQQYVLSKKQDEIKKVAPTDDEIRSFYEMNKANFVQSDMLKLFLVVAPKGDNAEAAKAKIQQVRNDLNAKKTNFDKIKADSLKDKIYQGGDLLISKTAQHAKTLGISYNELLELFGRDIGYTSDVNETENDYQFYVIRQKYAAKMLGLSDLVQPETTLTVYDYIRSNLTQQKQSQALVQAVNDLTKSLDTPENVDRKKTGDALTKLLNWEK